MTDDITRRTILAAGAAAGRPQRRHAGGPDHPGPHDEALSGPFPDTLSPPATDIGDLPESWASFNNAPRHIQNGGLAR